MRPQWGVSGKRGSQLVHLVLKKTKGRTFQYIVDRSYKWLMISSCTLFSIVNQSLTFDVPKYYHVLQFTLFILFLSCCLPIVGIIIIVITPF